MHRLIPLLLLATLGTGCAWVPRAYVARADHSKQTQFDLVEGSPMYRLIPRGWIAPVDKPRFVDASDADFMEPDEPVIVVQHAGETRVYSTWYLDGHEVVNDTIGDKHLAVTWCPLVQAGVVFDRELDGEALRLQASGRLWRDALVMYDKQTGSHWTQHGGRALLGAAAADGVALAQHPSARTTWADAVQRHPGARVLVKKAGLMGSGTATIYDGYLERTDQLGIFGTHLADDRLPGKSLVFGFVRPESAYALAVEGLGDGVAMSVGGDPVFVHALPGGEDARVWHRTDPEANVLRDLAVGGDGAVVDTASGLRWDALSGQPLDGEHAPLRMEQGSVVYWFAWQQNHPESRVWAGESLKDPRATAEN
jgi:hypothetical protein